MISTVCAIQLGKVQIGLYSPRRSGNIYYRDRLPYCNKQYSPP